MGILMPRASSAARVFLLSAFMAVCWISCGRSDRADGSGARRITELRLSAGTAWEPCEESREGLQRVRCGQGDSAATASSSPASLDRRYQLLARGDARSLDRLVNELRRAVQDAPSPEAGQHNDLAVAYFARAHFRNSPVDLIYALGSIERASSLDPTDEVVRFNRALVLDRLGLLETAEAAWDDYIEIDASGYWAAEAAERKQRLRPAVRSTPPSEVTAAEDAFAARTFLQDRMLSEWALAAEEDPAAARTLVEAASVRADELRRATEDSLLSASLERVRLAYEEPDPRLLADLVEGHRLYALGLRSIQANAFAEAAEMLADATAILRRAETPFALWSSYQSLVCAFEVRAFTTVEEGGLALLGELKGAAPSALRAQVWFLLGTSRFALGELTSARLAYSRSLDEFLGLGETPRVIAAHGALGDLAEWTGDGTQAWRLRYLALDALRRYEDPQRRRLVLLGAAFSASDLGEQEAARAIMDEIVLLARLSAGPLARANALLKRGSLLTRVGEHKAAQADFDDADLAVNEIVDEELRGFIRSELLIEQGRLLLHSAPLRATEVLQEAWTLARSGEAKLLEPEIEFQLARSERAAGDPRSARLRLRRALSELTRQRTTVRGDAERVALSDRIGAVSDELVSILLDEGDIEEALRVADAARARRLLERLSLVVGEMERDSGRRSLVAPWTELGPSTTTLVYSLLEDQVVIWVLGSEGIEVHQVRIAAASVRKLVFELRRSVEERDGDPDRWLEQLFDVLVAPVRENLDGKHRLIISPQEELFLVPFAALKDRQTGRYLVEDLATVLIPSLSTALKSAPRSALDAGRPPRSVLVLADPMVDPELYPDLPPLPGARREAAVVERSYRAPGEALVGPEATLRNLLARLGRHEVLHVAAHGRVNSRDPFNSTLVLASEGGAGEVRPLDLVELNPGRCRIVILAACDSAGTTISPSEGPLGLAWPFLARGVPEVVATLWSLDDTDSVALFSALHREIAAGSEVHDALRSAQLRSLQRGVRSWAAPIVFGLRFSVPSSRKE